MYYGYEEDKVRDWLKVQFRVPRLPNPLNWMMDGIWDGWSSLDWTP